MTLPDWISPRVDREVLRALPRRALLTLLAAVFCVFAAAGPLVDISHVGGDNLQQIVAISLLSGLAAVGYVLASLRSWPWFLPVALVQIGGMALIVRWDTPQATHDAASLALRLKADAVAVLVCLLLSYSLFFLLIKREGMRSLGAHAEIALAREIHETLVPPVDRQLAGWELSGVSVASGEVGGDLLDLIEHERRWLAIVSDVSGHGVPAGLLMAMVKSAAHMRLEEQWSLDAFLRDLNRVVHRLKRRNMFATIGCIAGDASGRIEYVLAGQPPLLVLRAASGQVERHRQSQLPLGVLAQREFERGELTLEPGDVALLLTDGVSEAFDSEGRQLGLEPLEELLRQHAGEPPARLCQRLLARSERHGRREDDQTLLVLRRTPGARGEVLRAGGGPARARR